MIQVEYKIKLGQDEFIVKAEVKDEIEFFKKMSFYSNLPKVGPNGETDLKITHRTTTQGYNYYSLVSEKAGQEFKFGQVNDKDGGLYPKGWSPIFQGNNDDQAQQQNTVQAPLVGAPVQAPAPVQQQQYQPQVAAPVAPPVYQDITRVSQPVQTAPIPAPGTNPYPSPHFPGMVPPHVGPSSVAQPAPQQTQAPAANPVVAAAANNVLQRFGINPKQ